MELGVYVLANGVIDMFPLTIHDRMIINFGLFMEQ
jgi:hypothetical protein